MTGGVQSSQRSEDRGMTSNRIQGGNWRGWLEETMSCQKCDKSTWVEMSTLARINFDLDTHKHTHAKSEFALLLFVVLL